MADPRDLVDHYRLQPLGFGLALAGGLLLAPMLLGSEIHTAWGLFFGGVGFVAWFSGAFIAAGLHTPTGVQGSGLGLLGALGLTFLGAVGSVFLAFPLLSWLVVAVPVIAFTAWARDGRRVGRRSHTLIAFGAVVVGAMTVIAAAAFEAFVLGPDVLIREPGRVPPLEYLESAEQRVAVWLTIAPVSLGIVVIAIGLVVWLAPTRIDWREVVVVGLTVTGVILVTLDLATWDTGGDLSSSPRHPEDYPWRALRASLQVSVFAAAAVVAGFTASTVERARIAAS